MLGRQRPFSPSVPAEAGCLLLRPMFMFSSQGRAYTVSWLVGVQIKVIATSDLWLFIHASNLLPSTPHTTPLQNLALASRIGSRRVTHRPGDSVEELSGGRSSGPDHQQHGRATAVASDPATEVTTPMNLFRRRSASSGTSGWRKEQQWSG